MAVIRTVSTYDCTVAWSVEPIVQCAQYLAGQLAYFGSSSMMTRTVTEITSRPHQHLSRRSYFTKFSSPRRTNTHNITDISVLTMDSNQKPKTAKESDGQEAQQQSGHMMGGDVEAYRRVALQKYLEAEKLRRKRNNKLYKRPLT